MAVLSSQFDTSVDLVTPENIAFRYHIAIENHIAPHHWTEKLADVFLGHSLPFYHGCPNAADYFPADSFIPIDIHQPERVLEIIRQAIDRGEYERRLPAIVESRRRVHPRPPRVRAGIGAHRHRPQRDLAEPGGPLRLRALGGYAGSVADAARGDRARDGMHRVRQRARAAHLPLAARRSLTGSRLVG